MKITIYYMTSFVPQREFIMFLCFLPYNKSFIDQACAVKMAGYGPRSFLACLRRKRTWPVSSHLDRTSLVNNPYVLREAQWPYVRHCSRHCVVFLDKTFDSQSASLHLVVQMGTGVFNTGGNPAMD